MYILGLVRTQRCNRHNLDDSLTFLGVQGSCHLPLEGMLGEEYVEVYSMFG